MALEGDDPASGAKGLAFRGRDPDTEWWHVCTSRVSATIQSARGAVFLDNISAADYTALVANNHPGQFPPDDAAIDDANFTYS